MHRFSGWVSLIFSRKVLLALIVAISASVMYAQGAITAEQLVDALMGLGAALILAIAAEDGAEKLGAARAVRGELLEAEEYFSNEPASTGSASDLPGRWQVPEQPDPELTNMGWDK